VIMVVEDAFQCVGGAVGRLNTYPLPYSWSFLLGQVCLTRGLEKSAQLVFT